MSLRFRRSIKIIPGVKINFNKNSVGLTLGGRGAHYTINSSGRRTSSIGIPGTGIWWQESYNPRAASRRPVSQSWRNKTGRWRPGRPGHRAAGDDGAHQRYAFPRPGMCGRVFRGAGRRAAHRAVPRENMAARSPLREGDTARHGATRRHEPRHRRLGGTADHRGAALARGDSTVRLDDGSLGIIPEEWLQQYGLLAGLGTTEGEHLRFETHQVGLLDALLAKYADEGVLNLDDANADKPAIIAESELRDQLPSRTRDRSRLGVRVSATSARSPSAAFVASLAIISPLIGQDISPRLP